MPFGAESTGHGTRFTLWAPAATRVELCLHDTPPRAMENPRPGWFELLAGAAPGSRYRFRIDGELEVPDPASRFQPAGVHGPSEVVDPRRYRWRHPQWRGRPWEEAVIYELHTGAFTPSGTYAGIASRLDYLRELGITAIELMPLGTFPGRRGWGYDGALPFAPAGCYGQPDELKTLIDEAHGRGLMVFVDVVYNHFGPEGNYLHAYAPAFFTSRHHTPWGDAIDFDGRDSHWVREFFIHNALYWLEEYRCDGLRLDAVHAIFDDSEPHILVEIAQRAREHFPARHVHLMLENDDNAVRFLERDGTGHYQAQWNDDAHHALHVLLTGEAEGYYADYADAPLAHLGRCLAEGFAWQGEHSAYRDHARGEPSAHLPPAAFIHFLQNHDQIGNRARGERIGTLAAPERVRAALAVLLLAPSPPLLFMGQEWACGQPFPFFCDFGPALAAAVSEGRRREFARFAAFRDESARATFPDPQDEATFRAAILDWSVLGRTPHREWLALHRELLALRHAHLTPRLAGMRPRSGEWRTPTPGVLAVRWRLGDGSRLRMLAHLAEGSASVARPAAPVLWHTPGADQAALPPWSVCWYLSPP
ncbi:MAG: malto-oligosyltrehalose trehalohydrolase [Gammaproteobacteria bacterium]|jgi:malto-oligosyltrehalose trehalohydrolase|nr:malto-oligosyltrehalose trehalohydrolase [Gammaproteobacteria bacterium]